MTTPTPSISDLPAVSLKGQRVEVRWTAVRVGGSVGQEMMAGPRHETLIISFQMLADHHGLLDAWIESGDHVRVIHKRRPTAAMISIEHDMVHVDAEIDNAPVLSLTLGTNGRADKLLYARSSLLAEAGLSSGVADRPTARLVQPEADAATA